jgi:hypothetical protein
MGECIKSRFRPKEMAVMQRLAVQPSLDTFLFELLDAQTLSPAHRDRVVQNHISPDLPARKSSKRG